MAADLANRAAGIEVSKIGATAVSFDEIARALEGAPLFDGQSILTRGEISKVVSQARGQGKRIVFTNGCYDILHVGHIKLLQRARALGDLLIVGLNDDASVRALKGGKRPLIGETERAHVLAESVLPGPGVLPRRRLDRIATEPGAGDGIADGGANRCDERDVGGVQRGHSMPAG